MFSTRARRLGAVAAGVALLAACDHGDTRSADHVGDTTARLSGYVHTDDAETVTWWFEYGPTWDLGSSTPEHAFTTVGTQRGGGVDATLTGLDEGTTYYYRHCVRGSGEGVVCGSRQAFTTTSGRDSVQGIGVSAEIPELGYYVGAILDASSEPDGSLPEGHASRSPGVHYFRIPDEGDVTCLRVEGDRAAVGFVADYTDYDPGLPLVPVVVYVEDNGSIGDRFSVELPAEPPSTCPDPDTVLDAVAGNVLIRGDFVVHDHP